MLMCDKTVTLVKHIPEKDEDKYTAFVIHGASWHSREKIVVQGSGAAPVKEISVRIPVENLKGASPDEGDFMVDGKITTPIEKPADLLQYKHFKITSVSDNRRGKNQHWLVKSLWG